MCDSYDRPHSSLRFGTDTLCVRFSRSISFACVTETRSLTNARRIVETSEKRHWRGTRVRANMYLSLIVCPDSYLNDRLERGIESVSLERHNGWCTTLLQWTAIKI